MLNKFSISLYIILLVNQTLTFSQEVKDASVVGAVDFSTKIVNWEGFGVNYVQAAKTHDYNLYPQDYGGFSFLNDQQRKEIVEMVFGDNGLKPSIIKMFLDPLHQKAPGAKFDHETSTKWMRYFVKEGLKLTRARGEELTVITTLYGPPAWATLKNQLNARDLDPLQFKSLAIYISDWVRFLIKEENIPVKYVSFFNEADKPSHLPKDGVIKVEDIFDYNTFWSPQQTAEFVVILRETLNKYGLSDVRVTPGECSSWSHFTDRMYAWHLLSNPKTLESLGLITSHSFGPDAWINTSGVKMIRDYKPEVKTWVTSSSWGNADMHLPHQIAQNVNNVKVNAMIPWALVQTPSQWHLGVDPNAAPPIRINEKGSYETTTTLSIYKHFTLAGRPGMATVPVMCSGNSDIELIGFGNNGTKNPNSFIVLNNNNWSEATIALKVLGTKGNKFKAIRTYRKYGTKTMEEYKEVGEYEMNNNGYMYYKIPPHSVTTFIELAP